MLRLSPVHLFDWLYICVSEKHETV